MNLSMPRFPSLLLALAICCMMSTGCSSNIHESPESLGKAFFEALVANDEAGIGKFFPGQDDWESMAKLREVPEDKYDEFKKDFQRRIEDSEKNEGSRFKVLQERAKEAGLDFSKAELDEVVVTKESMNETPPMANIEIRFQVEGKKQTMKVKNLGRLDKGWFLNRIPNWKP